MICSMEAVCLISKRRRECGKVGVIAQLVERVLSMHEALGSTPSNSIFLSFYQLRTSIANTFLTQRSFINHFVNVLTFPSRFQRYLPSAASFPVKIYLRRD